jgi:hypothetical protein
MVETLNSCFNQAKVNITVSGIITCCMYFLSPSLFAQSESDQAVLKRGESKIILFDMDSTFYCNLRLRVQNRAEYLSNIKGTPIAESLDARIRRLRLRLDGGLPVKGFSFLVQLNFANADLDVGVVAEQAFVRDAMLFYRSGERHTFMFGLGKLPGNRQRVISSGYLQFAERSLSNAFFNIDRDFGVQYQVLLGNLKPSGNYPVRLRAAITRGDGRLSQISDLGLCYTGRAEWLPLPNFEKNGDYTESDLSYHEKPALSVGITSGINVKADRTAGQLGERLGYETDIRFALADFMFKYRGLSLLGEWHQRRANVKSITDSSGMRVVNEGDGFNIQSGYMLSPKFELVARHSRVFPLRKGIFQKSSLSTFGVNRFFNGHRVKIQGYINYFYSENMQAVNSIQRRWGAGVQAEFGF